MFKKIDFSPGFVSYDDFDIDPQASFESQEFSFKQDMFQVSYGEAFIIDIGWYPEHEKNGSFWIRVIKDFDWENPIYSKKPKQLDRLYEYVQECSEIVRNLIKDEQKK